LALNLLTSLTSATAFAKDISDDTANTNRRILVTT
jgi:hypothetical protein